MWSPVFATRTAPSSAALVRPLRLPTRTAVTTSSNAANKKYQATMNLPVTALTSHYVAPSEQLQQRCSDELYAWQKQQRSGGGAKRFVLHDGPPYANGHPHLGHALNKILKDFVVRYKLMQGYQVNMIPGWDCHGLPIELKALERLKGGKDKNTTATATALSAQEIRKHARNLALEAIDIQRNEFRKWNLLGDWSEPYRTLDPTYEAAQLGVFAEMVKKNLIYRDFKPVYWSPSSRTALAEAELEYIDNHRSESVYVRFPVVGQANLSLLVWTTTPWTLPANQAVAINSKIPYCVAHLPSDQAQLLVVAKPLLDLVSSKIEQPLTFVRDLAADELLTLNYTHPLFPDKTLPVINGLHVSDDAGTGLVHTAPAHGMDDYKVCRAHDISIESDFVNALGKYTDAVGERLAGKSVLSDGTTTVIELLTASSLLVKHVPYFHRYPCDWRTKKPIILRATAQWFCNIATLRDQAVSLLSNVRIVPPVSQNRLASMLQGRDDWCISRQRVWGVPIPVFYELETDKPLLTSESIAHVQSKFIEHGGSDCWWSLPIEELLPPSHRGQAAKYRKGEDTMDVWFDSGSSWAHLKSRLGVNDPTFSADIYLEGSDQHRGWFQSSLLTSVANQGVAPYRQLVTHGFLLDEKGVKMSKSIGNVIEPSSIVLGGKDKKKQPAYGVDVMRLWVATTEYSGDVSVGALILEKVGESFRKIRNTMRFMVSNIHDFRQHEHALPYESLTSLDKYMLHVLSEYVAKAAKDFDAYEFNRIAADTVVLTSNKISSFFAETSKDRLYANARDSLIRRSAQTVLFHMVHNVSRVASVLIPGTAESIYDNYKACIEAPLPSLGMYGWPVLDPQWNNPALAEHFDRLIAFRDAVNIEIEKKRKEGLITMSDQAHVEVSASSELATSLQVLGAEHLVPFLVVASATVATATENKTVINVTKAPTFKCPRCWMYHSIAENELCARCVPVVASLPTPP